MDFAQNRIIALADELGRVHAPLPVASSPLDWERKNENPYALEKVIDFDAIRAKQKAYSDAILPILYAAVKTKSELGDSGNVFLVVNTRKAERSEMMYQLAFNTKTFHFLKAETIVVDISKLQILNSLI